MLLSSLSESFDVSAVSPSYTLTSRPSSDFNLCDNDSPSTSVLNSSCSDFSLLTIDATGFSSSSSRVEVLRYGITSLAVWSIGYTYYPFYNNQLVISLNNTAKFSVFASSDFSSGSFTFTFSNDPIGCSGIVPDGSITLSSNGEYDVSSYATAIVDVPAVVEPGDYHDDLISINNSILIVGSICLVIYFFYAIYKMILGGLS